MTLTIWNVTIDPASPASAVDNPEIKEVRDTRSGRILDTRRFISGRRYDRLVQTRNIILEAMKRGQTRLVCAICGTPVYIVSLAEKVFFFRHRVEDGSCPAQTRGRWSEDQIRAMKYGGARESDAHRKVKALIERTLKADPRASNVLPEKRWRSKYDPSSYRCPDVQAIYGDWRLAFEVQLTTTFLDVVVGRRMFYKDQDALLIWILRCFDPSYRRLTEDDLLFTNNSNVLVVDEETTQLSQAAQRCMVRCHYREPTIMGRERREEWKSRIVGLDELTFDLEGQRAYWFDFDAADARDRGQLRAFEDSDRREAEERYRRRRVSEASRLRTEILAFFESRHRADLLDEGDMLGWERIRQRAAAFNVSLPFHPGTSSFRTAVYALLSAKHGGPVGFRYKMLVEVAHLLFERHKEHLMLYGWALQVYDQSKRIDAEDHTGRWQAKREQIRAAIRNGDPAYRPDDIWLDTIIFLFPETAPRIEHYRSHSGLRGMSYRL